MSLTDSNGGLSAADIAAVMGSNNGGWGFGNNGDWWVILFLFALMGNGFGGGFGWGGGGYAAEGSMIYPWMNQANITTEGFQNQLLNDNITSIRDGVSALSTQLCNTGNDIQMTLCNGFAGVEQGANTRQMANMQTAFSQQTAMNQGFNNVQSQLAQCCCDNKLASADLKYTIATENCADRQALNEGVRDIIANQTAGTQRILDQLCNDKIDAKNDEIAQLRQQLNMASLRESQIAQNAFISQGFANEVDQLYDRLNNCPVGTVPVYGKQPIFTCNQNYGCGCMG